MKPEQSISTDACGNGYPWCCLGKLYEGHLPFYGKYIYWCTSVQINILLSSFIALHGFGLKLSLIMLF